MGATRKEHVMAQIVIPTFIIPGSHIKTRLLRGDVLLYNKDDGEFSVVRPSLDDQKLRCELDLGGGISRSDSWIANCSMLQQPEDVADEIARRFGLVILTYRIVSENDLRWTLCDPLPKPPKPPFKLLIHPRDR